MAGLREDDYLLDLGTGTADMAIEAAKQAKKARIVGLDFSQEMLSQAREKIKRLGLEQRIELREGEVLPIPFDDKVFDCVTMGFLLRHINISLLLEEIMRVLKTDGRVVILDAGWPQNPLIKGIHYLYLYKLMPWLGRIFHGDIAPYRYLPESMDQYLPTALELKGMMSQKGFKGVEYLELLFGAAVVHMGIK